MTTARGPRSAFLLDRLRQPPGPLSPLPEPIDDPLLGEDTPLFLYLCYELHYRGLPGVDERWEWEPSLLAARAAVEAEFEAALRDVAGAPVEPAADIEVELKDLLNRPGGPSLSRYMADRGTLQQLREFAVHRSAYQLKEADPHSWAIPRLDGRAKAAMVEIQSDEYGGGRPGRSHAELFAGTMEALGLDPTYGALLDRIPGRTLTTVNLISYFGLHRRWRGALIGHLSVFEMTSVEPMGRYAAAIRRLGLPEDAAHFYDVHVEADQYHEQVAATGLAGGLARAEPHLAGDILFGARALMAVETRFTEHLLGAWRAGRSSLLPAA